ncbi:MAG: extracellular solute-binding protein [Planctomycetes bacterium]|nr:extracellular solute-binding protein [Planctomycetota bacterium]
MMRRGATVLVWLCAAVGCSDGDSRLPLVVYSPHGEDILRDFEQRFEQAHADVDVQWFNMAPQDCYTRIRGERERPSCDVWWGGPAPTMALAAEDGLLEPFAPSCIDAIPAEHRDAKNRYIGQFLLPQVIVRNRDRLDPKDAPLDWDDLAGPAWKGRVILRFPLPSGGMRTAFCALIDWKSAGSGDPAAGFAMLTALHRNTKRYATDPTELFEAITKDEANVVSVWNLTDVLFQHARYGYPLAAVVPRSGSPVLVDGIALVRRADADPRRAQLAREFAEMVMSLDALDLLMNDHFRIPTRTDVPVERKPQWLRELTLLPLPYDAARAASREREWMTHWERSIKPLARE